MDDFFGFIFIVGLFIGLPILIATCQDDSGEITDKQRIEHLIEKMGDELDQSFDDIRKELDKEIQKKKKNTETVSSSEVAVSSSVEKVVKEVVKKTDEVVTVCIDNVYYLKSGDRLNPKYDEFGMVMGCE